MGTPLVKVSYKNISGLAVPSWGVVQANGPCETTPTGDIVVQVVQPGSGNGVYLIDDGKGASARGAGRYGNGSRAFEGTCWAKYHGGPPPGDWDEVGPIDSTFYMDVDGKGYYYAGQYDSTNSRILVIAKTSSVPRIFFTITSFYGGVAIATINYVTCGGKPPGLNNDGTVSLYDVNGCYFNEINPSDGYVGRKGHADFVKQYKSSYVCFWAVAGLCCPPN